MGATNRVFSVKEMRELEQAAVDGGLSYLRLMDNAGSAAAREIRSRFSHAFKQATILCGSGNNGGDGFVIARKLMEEGARVTVVLMAGQPKTPPAIEMLQRIQPADLTICSLHNQPLEAAEAVKNATLIVDAVFGIGFHGSLPDYMRHLFRQVNRLHSHSHIPVVAVDLPSGMQADSGAFDPDTIRADITITFTALKPGLLPGRSAAVYGQAEVVDIGIDRELVQRFPSGELDITYPMVKNCFVPRPADSHKGTFGHVLCVGGSMGMAGAVRMSVLAALRSGTGLVTAAVPQAIYPIAAAGLSEPIFLPLPEHAHEAIALLQERMTWANALVLGCGLGTGMWARQVVNAVLTQSSCPLVLDADGINCAAMHIYNLKTAGKPSAGQWVLTPHPGEMARLLGCTVDQVQADRIAAAQTAAAQWQSVVVLKGHQTVIAAPGRTTLINHTGNPGMATGGSGDVLAGMIGAFLAQGLDPYRAAMCGVHLHGMAGDLAAQRRSQHAMLPTDMMDTLPALFLDLENG